MYTYAVGVLFFLAIWGVLFALARKSRKPILWSSLAWGHAGPISEYWHVRDYWTPACLLKIRIGSWVFGLEDYLFAFAFAGLCAGIFDLLARRLGQKELTRFDALGFIEFVLVGLACLLSMGALARFLNLNSLHAIVLTFLIGAAVIMIRRSRWIAPAVQTGFILAAMMWTFYAGFFLRLFPGIIGEWWNVNAMLGITLGGVPIEEVVWAWSAALFVGPVMRYCMKRAVQ